MAQPRIARVYGAVNVGSFRISAMVAGISETGEMIEPEATIALPVLGPISVIAVFERIPMYELRITVAGGNGSVSPEHRRGQVYPDGTVIDLVASPASGYIVDQWQGTDDDTLWTNANQVTVDGNKEVIVSFRQPKSLHVPGQYRSIHEAVNAASDHGDKIVVGAGIHRVNSIDFQGKAITVASEHPDDPNCVATTILDAAQLGRVFVFQSGEGADSVVDGFTIRNGSAVFDPCTPNSSGCNGAPGEDALGGALACFNGSSPTLSNLIIANCVAQGRNGDAARRRLAPGLEPVAGIRHEKALARGDEAPGRTSGEAGQVADVRKARDQQRLQPLFPHRGAEECKAVRIRHAGAP